ncbi:unnamed protein product, partial [Rotaria magnacalcarata]
MKFVSSILGFQDTYEEKVEDTPMRFDALLCIPILPAQTNIVSISVAFDMLDRPEAS